MDRIKTAWIAAIGLAGATHVPPTPPVSSDASASAPARPPSNTTALAFARRRRA